MRGFVSEALLARFCERGFASIMCIAKILMILCQIFAALKIRSSQNLTQLSNFKTLKFFGAFRSYCSSCSSLKFDKTQLQLFVAATSQLL